jgi:hypothetical protein
MHQLKEMDMRRTFEYLSKIKEFKSKIFAKDSKIS